MYFYPGVPYFWPFCEAEFFGLDFLRAVVPDPLTSKRSKPMAGMCQNFWTSKSTIFVGIFIRELIGFGAS